MVRILVIVLVAIVAIAGIGYFVLPAKASRTELFTVERPAESVFARLASTPAGTQIAEGVTLTEVTSAANNVVVGSVTYPEGATGQVTYTVSPEGEGSRVQVKLDQDLGPNPLARVDAITGGKVAPFAEAAAAAVTADLNALPNASFTGLNYEVVQIEARPFFYVQNCSPTDPETITSIVQQALSGARAVMSTLRLQQAGPPMAVEPRVVNGQYCYQVGMPYSGRTPGVLAIGTAGQTPSGTMLKMVYTGDEAQVVPQVYDRMDALLAAAHLDNPGTRDDDWTTYEVYNDDPMQPGGSRNREVYYVSQGDIAALTRIAPPTTVQAPAVAPAPEATSTATTATTTTTTTAPAPATP